MDMSIRDMNSEQVYELYTHLHTKIGELEDCKVSQLHLKINALMISILEEMVAYDNNQMTLDE